MTSEFKVRKVYKVESPARVEAPASQRGEHQRWRKSIKPQIFTLRTFAFCLLILLLTSFLFLTNAPRETFAAEQVRLTATVEPLASAADMQIAGSPVSGSTMNQSQETTVTISYKHNEAGSFPMKITGSWEQGLIEGTSSNYIDIFEYVIGSATNADDGTVPVVDLVNRKITWNIPSVSSSVNFHNVSFKLKVRDDIPTSNNISVDINSDGVFSSTTLPQKFISYNVKKSSNPPGPTSSIVPTTVPLTSISPTKAPVKIIPPDFEFDYVRIGEIGDTYFNVIFQTNKPSTYTLLYGLDPNSLTKKVSGLSLKTIHDVTIPDLILQTQYYFRIVAKDSSGEEITSDLFTATTASGKEAVKLGKDDFTVSWRKYLLLSQTVNSVVIPRNKPVTIAARIGDSSQISKIKAMFKNTNVLGINNVDPLANVEQTPLFEILPGIFSGEIQSPTSKGIYAVVFEITEVTGGKYTKVSPYKFYVSDPLRITDKKTGEPIENATVNIMKYEEGSKQFNPLSDSFALPTKTDQNGELDVVLPTGSYIIEVKHARYKTMEEKVEIGISSVEYPRLEMEPDHSFRAQAIYYKEEVIKLWDFAALTIRDFFSSANNKDVFLIFSILFLIFLVLLNLHLRKKSGMVDRVLSFSILDIIEFLTVLCGLLFIQFLGIGQTGDLAVSTLVILALGLLYIRRAFFRKSGK